MKRFRCKSCRHMPRRVVSVTSKRKGSIPAEPRQHKLPCDCRCHSRSPVAGVVDDGTTTDGRPQ